MIWATTKACNNKEQHFQSFPSKILEPGRQKNSQSQQN